MVRQTVPMHILVGPVSGFGHIWIFVHAIQSLFGFALKLAFLYYRQDTC